MNLAKPSLRVRLILLWGVLRRLFWHVCRPGAMRASLARRLGECRRCGACCQLFRRCPHLEADKGLSACRLYGRYRPPNCRQFPIDPRDLADRDLIAPDEPCGYSWTPKA
jgi:hypothetical protein